MTAKSDLSYGQEELAKMKSREEIKAKIKYLEPLIDCEGSEAFVNGLKWCLGTFKL